MSDETLDRGEVEAAIRSVIADASPEVRELVKEVVDIERGKLHMKLPRDVINDLADAVERIVRS